jgi:predicted nucleic acid-binding protein
VSVVVDASLVVGALIDRGPDGAWADSVLVSGPLAAPALMPVEAANILRRAALAGDVSSDAASQAHRDVLDLRIDLYPYAPLGPRVWELRQNLTAYDAWYVALAETLDVPLASLDLRLARATGPGCRFLLPPQPA